MSKHVRKTCLRSVALEVEDTALIWMLTSAKSHRKEIMSSRSIPFIYLGLHTDYISAFTC